MKSLLHIPYFMVGFITHQRTVEVKKSEGAISNGKSFDGTGSASKALSFFSPFASVSSD